MHFTFAGLYGTLTEALVSAKWAGEIGEFNHVPAPLRVQIGASMIAAVVLPVVILPAYLCYCKVGVSTMRVS